MKELKHLKNPLANSLPFVKSFKEEHSTFHKGENKSIET